MSNANPQQARVRLGQVRDDRVHQRRRQEAPGDPHQAGQLRSVEEVPADGLHLRGADAGPAQLHARRTSARASTSRATSATATSCSARTSSTTRASRARAPRSASSRRSTPSSRWASSIRSAIGIQGHSWGGVPDHAPDHADEHLRGGRGGRVGVEHDQRLRRHPLGHRHGARVPVREDAEPHRRAAVGRAAAVHRELADLLGEEDPDAVPDDPQRRATMRCRGTRGSSSTRRCGGWARKPTCSATTASRTACATATT